MSTINNELLMNKRRQMDGCALPAFTRFLLALDATKLGQFVLTLSLWHCRF